MQRMGMVIGLEPDRVGDYRKLHAEVWPDILALIGAWRWRGHRELTLKSGGKMARGRSCSSLLLRRAHGCRSGSSQTFTPMSNVHI